MVTDVWNRHTLLVLPAQSHGWPSPVECLCICLATYLTYIADLQVSVNLGIKIGWGWRSLSGKCSNGAESQAHPYPTPHRAALSSSCSFQQCGLGDCSNAGLQVASRGNSSTCEMSKIRKPARGSKDSRSGAPQRAPRVPKRHDRDEGTRVSGQSPATARKHAET